jgi:hypothetical protein
MMPKYELVTDDRGYHKDHWSLKILDGELEGLAYQYDTISFNEDEEGQVFLNFNILTIDNPNECDLTSSRVTDILGQVLVELVTEHMNKESENGDGNSNTEAPTE